MSAALDKAAKCIDLVIHQIREVLPYVQKSIEDLSSVKTVEGRNRLSRLRWLESKLREIIG